jgi:hypothetical protein
MNVRQFQGKTSFRPNSIITKSSESIYLPVFFVCSYWRSCRMAKKRNQSAEEKVLQYAQRLQGLIAAHREQALEFVARPKALETARQWLARANVDADDPNCVHLLMAALALALDIAIFAPSMSGRTAIDRLAQQFQSTGGEELAALAALKQARFRLLRIRSEENRNLLLVEDVATGEYLTILGCYNPTLTPGVRLTARLCPLDNGFFVTSGPLARFDDEALEVARPFMRPGKGLTNPERCAAALYRHIVRRGTSNSLLPDRLAADATESVLGPDGNELDRLAYLWAELESGVEPSPASLAEVRNLTSEECLWDALISSVAERRRGRKRLAEAYSLVASIQLETLHRREVAGIGDWTGRLDHLAAMIQRGSTEGTCPPEVRHLFDDLRCRLSVAPLDRGRAGDELNRVIQRIRGLRAKTVDQGCSEQEALASANKVAELLDRFGLSLSEIEFKQQTCQGIGIDTTRRKRAAVDNCIPVVADFCDCKVWTEESPSGTFRYVFFGLSADIEAAHYLYDLIHVAFDEETAHFKAGEIYSEVPSFERRSAVNSFQLGLSRGICEKLKDMKTARYDSMQKSSGRDLVQLKQPVIDEEMAKLGLSFHSRTRRHSKHVLADAFKAGKAVGHQFQVHAGIEATIPG